MKKKKRTKMFGFIQDWGLFPDQTLVVVGVKTKEDVIRIAKKNRANKAFIAELEKRGPLISEPFFLRFDTMCRGSILRLAAFEDTWEYWETLIHELNHAVEMVLVQGRNMEGELEALAYTQEQLFRAIRRKLQGIDNL